MPDEDHLPDGQRQAPGRVEQLGRRKLQGVLVQHRRAVRDRPGLRRQRAVRQVPGRQQRHHAGLQADVRARLTEDTRQETPRALAPAAAGHASGLPGRRAAVSAARALRHADPARIQRPAVKRSGRREQMMAPAEDHQGGLGVGDQIERYRTAFIAVVTMVVIAAAVGGYILAHENLKLPGWVPVLGHDYYTLKAEFQTAQAVTPGQGQAVTIAGAKVGEVASVDLQNGVAVVTMKVDAQVRPLLPQRDAAAASEDPAAGHHRRGQPGHARGRQAAQRRSDPALADRAERELRRIPRRPGRRNEGLPAGAARRRRRRPRPQRPGAVGDASSASSRRPATASKSSANWPSATKTSATRSTTSGC